MQLPILVALDGHKTLYALYFTILILDSRSLIQK